MMMMMMMMMMMCSIFNNCKQHMKYERWFHDFRPELHVFTL